MPRYDMVREDVPPVRKRLGDSVVAGSNNTAIVLGMDRKDSRESGHGGEKGSGAIYIVTGRSSENYDLSNDASFVYLSMKSDIDEYVGSTGLGQSATKSASAAVKSDHIRLVARKDLKIKVGLATIVISSDGSVTIDGELKLGKDALEHVLKGESFLAAYDTHVHTDPASGLTGPPTVPAPRTALSSRTRVF